MAWPLRRTSRPARDGGTRTEAAIQRAVRSALASPEEIAGTAESAAASQGPHPSEYVLASYLEGRLAGSAEEAFERHAAACAACGEELVLAVRSGIAPRRDPGFRPWRIAAAIALMLSGLAAALLAGDAVRGRLEDATLAAVRGALGDRAQVEGASLTLAGGPGVKLAGLTVPGRSGDPPMLAAPSARFNVDVRSLSEGRVAGALHLTGPIINVVREPAGTLNIDAVLPHSTGDARDLLARARKRSIREVDISSGTLRLIDRSGGDRRELRMASVDASVKDIDTSSVAKVSARAGFESTRQNLRVVGEVGPWGQGTPPAYRFSEVALDQVPLRSLPGIGSAMRGGLSFSGNLASSGESWGDISNRFVGGGDLQIVSGSAAGHNVVGDVISPLLGAAGEGNRPSGALQAMLAGEDTSFGELRSSVRVAGWRLEASDLALSGSGFDVKGGGAVSAGGVVEFRGELAMSAEATREVLALAPGAGALLDDQGRVAIPFGVSGRWPDVRVSVDVEKVAARALLRRGFAQLLFAPRG